MEKLDEFFTKPYQPRAIARDITGLIGQYCHGNEPDHHAPYLYAWAGAPWRTQQLIRSILGSMYGSDQAGLGLAGMDDRGENSAWYVMSAMGFYPVDPSRPEYILGSPLFDEAIIHLGNGKRFTITANNNSEKNCYIPLGHAEWRSVAAALVRSRRIGPRRRAGADHGRDPEPKAGGALLKRLPRPCPHE